MDDDNSRSLDINEFKKAAKDYRFDLTDTETKKPSLHLTETAMVQSFMTNS